MSLDMDNVKKRKEILCVSIIFLAAVIFAEYIGIFLCKYTGKKEEYTKTISVNNIKEVKGYNVNGNRFVPQDNKSYFVIGDCKDTVSKVIVNFNKPLEKDMNIKLYYKKINRFTEEKFCNKHLYVGDTSTEFNFNLKKYKYISINIDGEFNLDNVELHLNKNLMDSGTEIKLIVISVCIDIALLGFVIFLNRKILIYLIGKIKNRDKNIIDNKADKKLIETKKIHINIEKTFLIWSIIGGVVIGILVPTYQSPDELAHINMMQNEIGLKGYAEDILNGHYKECDAERIKAANGEKLNNYQYTEGLYKKFSDDLHVTFKPNIRFVRHFAANIGFLISVIAGLPIFWCLQIAELCSLFFYVIVGYYALKIMPIKKEILAVIMLLPMSLHQACSINYDATLLPICFLYIAYIMYLLYSEKKIRWKDIAVIFILLLLMAIIKLPYAMLILLILILPLKQYALMVKDRNVMQLVYKYRWLLICAGAIVMFTGLYILRYNVNILAVVASIIKLPRYIYIFLNTIRHSYMFYITSTIGSFGWLDCSVGALYRVGVILFCILLTQADDEIKSRFTKKKVCICLLSFIVILNFVHIAMENWTVVVNGWTVDNNLSAWLSCIEKIDIIQGVQGRYFIPILPLVAIVIPVIKKIRKDTAVMMINVYGLISVVYVAIILIDRYWIGHVC